MELGQVQAMKWPETGNRSIRFADAAACICVSAIWELNVLLSGGHGQVFPACSLSTRPLVLTFSQAAKTNTA